MSHCVLISNCAWLLFAGAVQLLYNGLKVATHSGRKQGDDNSSEEPNELNCR